MLAALFMNFGLSERVAKGAAILLIVFVVLLSLYLWGNSRYNAGVEHMQAEIAKANERYLAEKARADEAAAAQRITDTIAVSRREGELRDAIAATPDTAPDAVRIQLGCERLRRSAGGNSTSLPSVCRSGR